MSCAVRSQLVSSQMYQLREPEQICPSKPIKRGFESKRVCFHVAQSSASRACQTLASSAQSQIRSLLPCCTHSCSAGEHHRNLPKWSARDSLGLSGSDPVLISLVKLSLVLQNHVGPPVLINLVLMPEMR